MRLRLSGPFLVVLFGCSDAADDRTPASARTGVGDAAEVPGAATVEAAEARVLPDCFLAATEETWSLLHVSEQQKEQLRSLQASLGTGVDGDVRTGSDSARPDTPGQAPAKRDAQAGPGTGSTTGQAVDETFRSRLGAVLHTDHLRALAQWCDTAGAVRPDP